MNHPPPSDRTHAAFRRPAPVLSLSKGPRPKNAKRTQFQFTRCPTTQPAPPKTQNKPNLSPAQKVNSPKMQNEPNFTRLFQQNEPNPSVHRHLAAQTTPNYTKTNPIHHPFPQSAEAFGHAKEERQAVDGIAEGESYQRARGATGPIKRGDVAPVSGRNEPNLPPAPPKMQNKPNFHA